MKEVEGSKVVETVNWKDINYKITAKLNQQLNPDLSNTGTLPVFLDGGLAEHSDHKEGGGARSGWGQSDTKAAMRPSLMTHINIKPGTMVKKSLRMKVSTVGVGSLVSGHGQESFTRQ